MIQKNLLEGFKHCFALFYPNLCLACGLSSPPKKEIICLSCQNKLPKTFFHLDKDNPFAERFWGRLPIWAAGALYHFSKGGRTQQLIHQLKYNNKPDIGRQLGQYYGQELAQSDLFRSIDVIVPVPLHPRKKHQRGYNQSDAFAQGLSIGLGKPWLKDGLGRLAFTHTQTQKSRAERMENVMTAFEVRKAKQLAHRHILLVDDVITTGATLEACGLQLLALEDTHLSLATIGFAGY